MKKYYICFFVLTVLLTAVLLTGACFYLYAPKKEGPIYDNSILESESVAEDYAVVNQNLTEPERYCLAASDGFLFIFAKDRKTVYLDTHMPLSEFPETEQKRLLEGIWFSSMMEIFNYMESYSS